MGNISCKQCGIPCWKIILVVIKSHKMHVSISLQHQFDSHTSMVNTAFLPINSSVIWHLICGLHNSNAVSFFPTQGNRFFYFWIGYIIFIAIYIINNSIAVIIYMIAGYFALVMPQNSGVKKVTVKNLVITG